jgi:hypothetical protein
VPSPIRLDLPGGHPTNMPPALYYVLCTYVGLGVEKSRVGDLTPKGNRSNGGESWPFRPPRSFRR